jgi:O-glycosyl hydrolase
MNTLLFRPLQYLSAPRSSRCALALAVLTFLCLPPAPLHAVTVDGSQTFQVIDGFGANLRHWATNEVAPVLDALVDQAGMTLFRIIRDRADWETTNANSDPSVTNWVMNWAYYNSVYSAPEFETQWDMIAYLNQKGITNGISLNFMGVGPTWLITSSSPTFLIPGYEPQWAEMLTSLMLYARNARHLQFNLVEPNNEPDQLSDLNKIRVTQSQQVTALEALAQCLDANGLSDIRFVSPDLGFTSTSCMSALMNSPIIMPKLAHMGIHCYNDNFGGPSTGVYSFLQQSGHPDLNFWMTEFNEWCQSCEGGGSGNDTWSFAQDSAYYLLNHLANGAAGAMVFTGCDTWMAYLNSNMGAWSYWGLFAVDNINATPKTFTARKGFYTLSQISKYVRPGARRIGLTGSTSPFNLLAFYHPVSGQLTLTGVNPSGASPLSGTLASLPPFASFDLYYTSSTANLASGGTVPISSGAFSATIPGYCVFTLVARPGLSVLLTNPPDGATYSSPATLSLQAAASASASTVTGVAFFAGNTALGQTTVAPYSLTWSNVPPGAYTLTAWVTNSLGNTAVSPAVHVTVIGPPAQVLVSPSYALVPPNGTQQFNATVTDALGASIVPPPSVAWSVSGGASIDTNGLLTSGGTPGGPFSVLAHGAGLTGSAIVNIATNGTPFLPYQPDRLAPELSLLTVTNSAVAGPFVTQFATNSFSFAYSGRDALVADGWSFYATNSGSPRNTEFTNPASSAILYNPAGPLTIPCDVGDLWQIANANNTRNTLFRFLPTNWFSLQLALTFVPTATYQQAHLVLYQDDDNYLEVGESYHPDGRVMTMSQETGGSAATLASVSASPANAWFRLDRNSLNNAVTGFYSLDGANWNTFATVNLPLINPRLAIWTGGSSSAYTTGMPVMVVRGLNIVASNTVPRTLAYSLLSPPSGAAIDTNGIITWQPKEAQGPGTNVLTTVVVDNSTPPLNLTNSFTVIVQEVNTPPSLPFQASRTLVGQQTLIVTNTATDTDIPPNPLSYQLAAAPAGVAIDANGVITWTPAPNQVPGTNSFTTVVTDSNPWAVNDQHLSATNSFTVVVAPLPQFHILSVAASNNAVWIAWESTPGRTYRLQYKNNLAETNWQEILPDILAAGPATTATNTLGSGPSRLYRVRLLP